MQLPGYTNCQLTVDTQPIYKCVGFNEYMSPRMRYVSAAGTLEQYALPASLVKFADLDIPVPQPLNFQMVYHPNEGLFADVQIGDKDADNSSDDQGTSSSSDSTYPAPPAPPQPSPNPILVPTPDTTPEDIPDAADPPADPQPRPSNRPDTPYPRRRRYQ